MRINQSQQLGSNEKYYCDNFLTKDLITYIYEKTIKHLSPYLRNQTAKEQRFAHLRFTHMTMIQMYGKNLNNDYVDLEGGINNIEKIPKELCQLKKLMV
jgi:hypothetical protein